MFTPVQGFYANVLTEYAEELTVNPFYLIKLFANNITPIEGSLIGDFTEADFTGYVADALVNFNAVTQNSDGTCSMLCPFAAVFTQTAVTVSQLIYGYIILDNAGNLVGGEKFNAPINFNRAGVSIGLVVALVAGPAGISPQATLLQY